MAAGDLASLASPAAQVSRARGRLAAAPGYSAIAGAAGSQREGPPEAAPRAGVRAEPPPPGPALAGRQLTPESHTYATSWCS